MGWGDRAAKLNSLLSLAEKAWKWTPAVLAVVVTYGSWLAAKASKGLAYYGPISWIVAGLTAGLLFAGIYYLLAAGLLRYARFQWLRGLPKPAEPINPLDTNFHHRKIDINAFKTAFSGEPVENKKFIDCHLIGPAIVLFHGNVRLLDIRFTNCDFVAIEENRTIFNVIAFNNITIQGGRIYNMTILVARPSVSAIPAGSNWITDY